MLLLDDPLLLYRRRKDYPLKDYLKQHLNHIHTLQYQGGKDIEATCRHLNRELAKYAQTNSPVYATHHGVIDKSHLGDKNRWYVGGFQTHAATTGGSTTGLHFHYLRWATHYNQIEGDCHYRAILQEFGLDRPISILYLMLDQTDDRGNDTLTKLYHTQNILVSHGAGQQAIVHEVIKNRTYYHDYFGFFDSLFAYLSEEKIDVILAPGQIIAALAWNARRLRHTAPICKLLSNTGAKVDRTDLDYLKESGIVENWCDHMRCWDGGITFFTCRHHTYHLLDGLAWTKSDKQNRLISDDYYSLPSPFMNYWNGDYGTVGKDYQKCKCGRYYRSFEISRTRSVVMAGVTNHEVRDRILKTDIDVSGIKRAETSGAFLRLFTSRPYSATERQAIRNTLPNLEINFVTEVPNG
jgi:hypothetical protein